MAPLVVLLIVTALVRAAGARGLVGAPSWAAALRFGLAAMFVVTGTAHFVGMRAELIAMVPPSLPHPGLLVSITGALEILGALGLVWRRTTREAALALGLLMVAMFPANVYAATHDLRTEWLDNLVPRTILQLVFLAATAFVAHGYRNPSDDRQHATVG
jgi:uncharacterized membrane protein